MVETAPRTTRRDTPARPGSANPPQEPLLEDLTPAQIVEELDKYIIGQIDAKRAVAVALRNRYRRQRLPDELRREVKPKNILMIGSTGVGKTEIARRVADIVAAPFVKVEATKFTEVGYVGRDVESIIRDLVEVAISMLHNERLEQVKDQASHAAVERLAEIMSEQAMARKTRRRARPADEGEAVDERLAQAEERRRRREQKRLLDLLNRQAIEEETVEIDVDPEPEGDDYGAWDYGNGYNQDDVQDSFFDFLDSMMPRRRMRRRVSVREARRILAQQEADRLVDFDAVLDDAIRRAEEAGVVFIDEIDKTISSESDVGGDISGEGVQRDLLPIVEGSTVMTRYGPVRTDHVLFIAAGSFQSTRPSDLIPELQGRLPIRVELQSLTEDDLYAILTEPQNALTKQYQALLGVEGLTLEFPESGLREVARLAMRVNQQSEDIGARRLMTILEKVIEEVSFTASEHSGEHVTIDDGFVRERVGELVEDEELSNFIL